MNTELVSPLYPPEGGPYLGFCCRFIVHWTEEMGEGVRNKYPRECGDLFKTEHYAWLHVASVHGVLREPMLPGVEKANPEAVMSDMHKIALDAAQRHELECACPPEVDIKKEQ